MLMKRLNSDRDIAPLVAQFVPVKLDTTTDQWQRWERQHQSAGSSIPILYVVRADGKTLYAKSGSLRGDSLPTMLVAALEQSGQILNEKEAKTISDTADEFEQHKNDGNLDLAIKSLRRVKKLGNPGAIASYANSAVRLNQLANDMAGEVLTRLQTIQTGINDSNSQVQLSALLEFYELKRTYARFGPVKPEFSAFQKSYSTNRELREIVSAAKLLDSARIAKSKTAQSKYAEKLAKLMDETTIDGVKAKAQEILTQFDQTK